MTTMYGRPNHFPNYSSASSINLHESQDPFDNPFESPGPRSNTPLATYSGADNHGRPYSGPPPPYPEYASPGYGGAGYSNPGYGSPAPLRSKWSPQHSKWSPRSWNRKQWFWVAVGSIIALVVIVVAAVESVKANAYPDYSPLNYTLVDTFIGSSFFENFDYFVGYDPAQGFVHYSNPDQSVSMNLTYATETSATLRVDNQQANASTGRHSARIYSKNTYNNGLFVFDVLHTPYGCASWPAVWLTDAYNWPTNGEIDVIEAVNRATTGNQMTLHTTDGCSMSGVKREMTGATLQTDCYNATDGNAGCGVRGAQDTYGAPLNRAGGGVYAMELRDAGIRMWFFPRDRVPRDVQNFLKPQPDNWGEALADFPSTDCDIGTHFRNQSITIDIDVCGNWAGSPGVYSRKSSCPGVCSTYAAMHPEAFDESYWEFASFRVYQAK